jgi:hypothetical protein
MSLEEVYNGVKRILSEKDAPRRQVLKHGA